MKQQTGFFWFLCLQNKPEMGMNKRKPVTKLKKKQMKKEKMRKAELARL